MLMERRNGPGATVTGVNLEGKFAPSRFVTLQAGFTFQKSEYEEAVYWSEDAEPATRMMRSPETYGYLTAQLTASKRWAFSLSGIYTGTMDVPHYAGSIAKDELFQSPVFFDLGAKATYTQPLNGTMNIQFYAGSKNIFDSFQDDFDNGELRDAGYVYGPREPRTLYCGIRLNYR